MRVLIVRLSAIGDVVFALPLAAALRKARPDAFIGWIVEEPAAALLAGNPLLDWIKVVPKKWLKRPSLVAEIRRDLRAQRFDIALDPQGLTKSAAAAWLSGAKTRIGFAKPASWEIAPWLNNTLLQPEGTHVVDINRSLLRALGAFGIEPPAPGTADFTFPPCGDRDAQTIAAFTAALPASAFALMAPWGTFTSKLWPLDRFLALARRLRDAHGFPSAMLGHGERERSAVADLAARSGGALVPAPDVGLVGVIELARRARVVVGCDSFPTHAAAAAGCPTVGLFGVSDPARVGPYYPATGKGIFAKLTLVRSRRERKLLGNENMLALGVDAAFAACEDFL